MENKDFKKLFGCLAQQNGFEYAFSGWIKESPECIAIIELQKSNYGNYYDMNIKIYIQGVFGNKYLKCKDLVKNDTGDIFTRQPPEYNSAFDLDSLMDSETRKNILSKLFIGFIVPEVDKNLTRAGIVEQARNGKFILPAIKKELGIYS